MVAIVTLHVTACAGGSNLAGAAVTDGYNIVYTNAYGDISVYWDNTVYAGYSVSISKSGFQTRQINIYNSQNGTTVTTCLDAAPTPPPPPPGGSGGVSCFIVTAATGSAQSDEVQALRTLRDRVTVQAPAVGRLIDAIYAEYWQFSPALANRIDGDDLLKEGTLMAAVRPLLAWYRLAGALALRGDVDAAKAEFAAACPAWMQPAAITGLVGRIRREGAVPHDAPAMLHDLANHLVRATALPLVDWAILEPLEEAWMAVARSADPAAAIADWMSRAPVSPMTLDGAPDAARVADLVAFDPAARQRLEVRLSKDRSGYGCGG